MKTDTLFLSPPGNLFLHRDTPHPIDGAFGTPSGMCVRSLPAMTAAAA